MARIILAEDDDIFAELVSDALIGAGHGVGVLDNGKDALAVIRARKPDVVVLDCNMPEASGITVLREMRKSPDMHAIPVLMLTGRRNASDVDIAYYEGASDYLKKPCDPSEVVFRVEELLAKRGG